MPLQAIALTALERLPHNRETAILFPSPRGGYFDLHNFRNRHWKPAQLTAGIEPLRRVYDLRHTFATFALRAGISTFDLSRYMGGLTMIDRDYGHLPHGREHAIRLLDELNASELERWTLVDGAWTSPTPEGCQNSDPTLKHGFGRDRRPSASSQSIRERVGRLGVRSRPGVVAPS